MSGLQGFLDWISPLLEDPSLTDLCINGAESIFADRGGGLERVALAPALHDAFSSLLKTWTLKQLEATGKTWDARYPFVDARIPPMHRLHAVFPPIGGTAIRLTLRRLSWMDSTHQKKLERSFSDDPGLPILLEAVQARKNLLLCGATGSGKTTLMNLLISQIPASERILALEDTCELSPSHPHFLSLESRPPNPDGAGGVSLRDLLKQSLRMRPERILLGECRGPEVLDLLQAINTGHQGFIGTLHANSPRDALLRMELLSLLSGIPNLSPRVLRGLIASGIHLIAHLTRVGPARRLHSIQEITGIEGDTILLRPVLEPPGCLRKTIPVPETGTGKDKKWDLSFGSSRF